MCCGCQCWQFSNCGIGLVWDVEDLWTGFMMWCNGDVWGLRTCVIICYCYFVCLQSNCVCPGSWCCLMARQDVSPAPGVLSDLYWALGSWLCFGLCSLVIESRWFWLCLSFLGDVPCFAVSNDWTDMLLDLKLFVNELKHLLSLYCLPWSGWSGSLLQMQSGVQLLVLLPSSCMPKRLSFVSWLSSMM